MPNRSYDNGNTDSRFKFTGKELDQELDINLYYFGARYYDPALARWTSVDPLAEKYSDMSPYNYCGNEPITKIDPNGKELKHKNPISMIRHQTAMKKSPTYRALVAKINKILL